MKTELNEDQRRKNQFKLIGIFSVAGIPVILAMTMYFGSFALPSGKTNKGELLIPALTLTQFGFQENAEGIYEQTEGKWLLIQTGVGPCEQACLDAAHTARQVNILMAREQERVLRVFLTTDGDSYATSLAKDYPNLRPFVVNEQVLNRLPHGTAGQGAWQLWISDPLGNVMLRYDESNTGYDLKDDLKKLLKLSNIG